MNIESGGSAKIGAGNIRATISGQGLAAGFDEWDGKITITETLGDFTKLFVMSWNEIVVHQADYQERWQENITSDDVLLRYKTRLLMKHAAAGPIKEFNPELMMAVMDHITVYEDGRLKIRFYDETEFEVRTE